MARKPKKKLSELKVISTLEYYDKKQMELEWGVTYMPEGAYKHVSCSYAERLPSWEDLKKVKEEYFGDEFVLQILPKKKYYVNVHPYCLHLFQFMGGNK